MLSFCLTGAGAVLLVQAGMSIILCKCTGYSASHIEDPVLDTATV